jgi:hypothetical protein
VEQSVKGWKKFCKNHISQGLNTDFLRDIARNNFNEYKVYPDSIQSLHDSFLFLAREDDSKVLIVYGMAGERYPFSGSKYTIDDLEVKVCPMSNENCDIIRELFPFTNPSPNKDCKISVGFGDRLGVASPGHIRLIKDLPVYPVLAQQSIRELNLTGRKFSDVIADAAWAVYQEGYTKSYGADGDHLKSREEVTLALASGCTMITLDCSEYISNEVEEMSESEIRDKYRQLDSKETERLESAYLYRSFSLHGGNIIAFSAKAFYKIVLVYYKAIKFSEDVYKNIIAVNSEKVDFEVSIDETLMPTSHEALYFVASELKNSGVKLNSMAPRFFGEFQKGIDYKGDLVQFEKEYVVHEDIACEFGFKLSIHSGSDKFSVFPFIGKYSGHYHLKTAGTNWLEAVRLIAEKNPDLYRRMHKFALAHFYEATKYYHVTTDLSKVPDIDKINDTELPSLLNLDDTRQLLHITYGLILQAKNPDGSSKFHSELYQTLFTYEKDYYKLLEKHLGKHLYYLGLLSK